jgi:hypothetical protein
MIKQLKNYQVPKGKWMLPMIDVRCGFSDFCKKFQIELELDRDDLDWYRFAFLELDGVIFSIEARPTVDFFRISVMTGHKDVHSALQRIDQYLELDPDQTVYWIVRNYDQYP